MRQIEDCPIIDVTLYQTNMKRIRLTPVGNVLA